MRKGILAKLVRRFGGQPKNHQPQMINQEYRRILSNEKKISNQILSSESLSKSLYQYKQLVSSTNYNTTHLALIFGRVMEYLDQPSSTPVRYRHTDMVLHLFDSLVKSAERMKPAFLRYTIWKCANHVSKHPEVEKIAERIIQVIDKDSSYSLIEPDEKLLIFCGLEKFTNESDNRFLVDQALDLIAKIAPEIVEHLREKEYSQDQALKFVRSLVNVGCEDKDIANKISKFFINEKKLSSDLIYSLFSLNVSVASSSYYASRFLMMLHNKMVIEKYSIRQFLGLGEKLKKYDGKAKAVEEELMQIFLRQVCKETIGLLEELSKWSGLPVCLRILYDNGFFTEELGNTLQLMLKKNYFFTEIQLLILLILLKNKQTVDPEILDRILASSNITFANYNNYFEYVKELDKILPDEEMENLKMNTVRIFIKRAKTISFQSCYKDSFLSFLKESKILKEKFISMFLKYAYKLRLIQTDFEKKSASNISKPDFIDFIQSKLIDDVDPESVLANYAHGLTNCIEVISKLNYTEEEEEQLTELLGVLKSKFLIMAINDAIATQLLHIYAETKIPQVQEFIKKTLELTQQNAEGIN